ncbi:hypothetical protein F4811DRAFT_571177 [Daldinia bambusicola]|nr:hypothetical protein F4811DRAFT_571177 [Daldinia bambusicola]
MAPTTNHATGLLALPRELRDKVYNNLENEDLTALAQTCKQLRSEALSTMPGGHFIDFGNFQTDGELRHQIEKHIEVKDLDLIAEPWYSSGSALKIGLTWKPRNRDDYHDRWRTSYWTISDLGSPMAKYIFLYRPKAVNIIFEAPATTVGTNFLLALLILRAKAFDISRILTIMERDWNLTPRLSIYFRGGRDPERPTRTRKSFWEMRPGIIPPKRMIRDVRWEEGIHLSKAHQKRKYLPYYYECLMLPLVPCCGSNDKRWGEEPIKFDIQPGRRQTSFVEPAVSMATGPEYMGPAALFDFARLSYLLHRRNVWYHGAEGSVAFLCVMEKMEYFSELADVFLEAVKGKEADQLRSYLWRMRNGRACNPFAGPLGDKLSEGQDGEAGPSRQQEGHEYLCACYGEDGDIRRKFIEWALEED